MSIEIKKIDTWPDTINESECIKISTWCFGVCLTEKEKVLITEKKARYQVPTKNMGVLSCEGGGGVHNVSYLGSEDVDNPDNLVWQFEIFAHKDAIIDMKEGHLIYLEHKGDKITT